VPGLKPGQLYGFRVHGKYEPELGLRFNSHKLLLDPYARSITGDVDWSAPVFQYRLGDAASDLSFDEADDAWGKPKSVVVADSFDWVTTNRRACPGLTQSSTRRTSKA
jgi:glycogen operon protein